jgi:ABC-type branched-subunit amino acid transport system ATPase component
MTIFGWTSLCAGYGEAPIIRDISVSLSAGDVLGVVGRNGVGKTTLCQALTGNGKIFAGDVTLDGLSLRARSADDIHRMGVSYCPQVNGVFTNLSVWNNLDLMASEDERQRTRALAKAFPFLDLRRNVIAGKLSGGERKILGFVRALAENERVFILDEPTEGVQEENVARMAREVRERSGDAVMIVVEQNITFLERCASHILIMDHGESIAFGTIAELNRETIKRHLII